MAKRANGEGTIYKLPDGRWRATVTVRVAGKLKRISRVRQKRADVVALLDELRSTLAGGVAVAPSETLGNFLLKWLSAVVRPNTAEHTYATYETAVRVHISPRLGGSTLSRLSPLHVEEFKAAMAVDHVKTRAAQSAFQTLRRALGAAVYPLRLIKSNPCDGIKPPKHTKKRMDPFEAVEVRLILDDARDARWHAFYAVAFGCGLRAGELFGLQWQDIDFTKSKLSISRQALDIQGRIKIAKPKTKHSVRIVDIPPIVRAALREHRAIQMRAGLAACEWVFPNLIGAPVSRSNFYHDEWRIRLARCGLRYRSLHNTRHTFATLALLAGVPAAVVSRAMGHSSPAITMQVYSHVLPSSENAAAIALDKLLG